MDVVAGVHELVDHTWGVGRLIAHVSWGQPLKLAPDMGRHARFVVATNNHTDDGKVQGAPQIEDI